MVLTKYGRGGTLSCCNSDHRISVHTQEQCKIRWVHWLCLNGVLKYHSVQHRHALLPVSIILDEGASSWSEDKVLRVLQGVLGPLVPRCSVRVKVVDEIDEGYFDGISLVKIDQIGAMRLMSQESVDRVD